MMRFVNAVVKNQEMVQDDEDRLFESGRKYEMEIKVDKSQVMTACRENERRQQRNKK